MSNFAYRWPSTRPPETSKPVYLRRRTWLDAAPFVEQRPARSRAEGHTGGWIVPFWIKYAAKAETLNVVPIVDPATAIDVEPERHVVARLLWGLVGILALGLGVAGLIMELLPSLQWGMYLIAAGAALWWTTGTFAPDVEKN